MPLELFQTPQQIIAPMSGIALYILCLKNDYVLSNDPCNRRFDPHKFSEISGCKYNKRNASSLKLKSPENSEDSLVAGIRYGEQAQLEPVSAAADMSPTRITGTQVVFVSLHDLRQF